MLLFAKTGGGSSSSSHARVCVPFILPSTGLMTAVEVAVCESEIQMAQKCGGWKQQLHWHSYCGKKQRCGLKESAWLIDVFISREWNHPQVGRKFGPKGADLVFRPLCYCKAPFYSWLRGRGAGTDRS